MDRTNLKMHKILFALAFGLALQSGWAGDVPAAARAEAALRGAGLMHASLVVPAQSPGAPRGNESSSLNASAEGEADTATTDEKRNHTTGMLLAALALMAGIVLRRWGSSQQ